MDYPVGVEVVNRSSELKEDAFHLRHARHDVKKSPQVDRIVLNGLRTSQADV